MPQPGSLLGDTFEQLRETGGKIAKEVAKAPVDIVKASFEQPIPDPTPERKQQLEAKDQKDLKSVRSGLAMLQEAPPPQPQEDRRIQQGASNAERGRTNQNAQMNNQQLSANMTPKKKPEPLVVQQKRQNKLQGAG